MGGGRQAWQIWAALGMAFLGSLIGGTACAHGTKQLSGTAAFYGVDYKGLTASGARYDPNKFTCAHRTLPFGTRLRVTDPRTRRSVVVTVTDRGPFNKGRMLDLSLAAAKALRMRGRGVIKVTATVQPRGTQRSAAAGTR